MLSMLVHVTLFAAVAGGQDPYDTRAQIQKALDEPAAIKLNEVSLGDALVQITAQTRIRLVMTPATMDLVPHGRETVIHQVEIANVPLRRALAELFLPLGMRLAVRSDHIEIVPHQALINLGRAPTWDELETFAWLYGLQPGSDAGSMTKLKTRLQFQLPIPGASTVLSDALRDIGAGRGDQVLTAACGQFEWTWHLSGKQIVVLMYEDQVRRLLQFPVSLRLNNRSLVDVLQTLARSVGVPIKSEPGAIASLPIYVQRNFSINVQDQSGNDVLDQIAAYTGLGFAVASDGVHLYKAPNTLPATGIRPPVGRGVEPQLNLGTHTPGINMGSPERSDPYVAKMVIPLPDGTSIEWLIRRSELPGDLMEMRKRDLRQLFETVRRKAAASHSEDTLRD